jgi:hypothetical protein
MFRTRFKEQIVAEFPPPSLPAKLKVAHEDILDILEDLPEEIEEGLIIAASAVLRTTGGRKRRQGSYAFCGRATVTISRPRFLDS